MERLGIIRMKEKKISEGLKQRLKETKIKIRERYDYLKSKEHKTKEDFEEFYFLRDYRFSHIKAAGEKLTNGKITINGRFIHKIPNEKKN